MIRAYRIELRHAAHWAENRVYTATGGSPAVAIRKAIKYARKDIRGRWNLRAMEVMPKFIG